MTAEVGKITCKACGKKWENRTEYLKDPSCGSDTCPQKEAMGRRNRNNKPALILMNNERFRHHKDCFCTKCKEEKGITGDGTRPVVALLEAPKKPRVRVNTSLADVLSTYAENEPLLSIDVPRAICVSIIVRGK